MRRKLTPWTEQDRNRLRNLWHYHTELPAWARVNMIASELGRRPNDVYEQLIYLRLHRPIAQFEDEALARRCAERQRVINERYLFPER